MFVETKAETKLFDSFDDACTSIIDNRDYQSLTCPAQHAMIDLDGFVVGNTKYPMYDVFVDGLFGLTKLPKKNQSVLPTENIKNDFNTLLHQMGSDPLCLQLLNGVAYSLYPSSVKGFRLPLLHNNFLDVIRNNIEISQIKKISLTPRFLRVTTFDDSMSEEVGEGDFHHFGIDYINGEIFKSNPLTAGLMIYRISCSNSAVAPFEDKYIRLRPEIDKEDLKLKFKDICLNLNIDYQKIKMQINEMSNIKLNLNLIKFIAGKLGFIPQNVKEKLFANYYEQDDDGKMTKIVKQSAINSTTLYEMYNEITREAHHNIDVDEITRYKIECFAGSLIDPKQQQKAQDLQFV